MNRRTFFASVALAFFAVAPTFGGCGGGDDSNPATSNDAGSDTAVSSSEDASDDYNATVPVADGSAGCLLFPTETDPVGLCVQRTAILGLHAVLTDAGVPANWSIYTLAPATTDAGTVAHDVRDDAAYGAALSAYAASAAAYADTAIDGIVTSDLETVAHLVEGELATLPADYDGALYVSLRRFAAGLRAASFTSDANAIDVLAASYGRAIYTSYFHVVTGGSEEAGPDDGGALDATTSGTDSGTASDDGILGTPSGGGFAYESDKAATGALALVDMAARAANGTVTPPGAGVDAATLADPTDTLAWSQAATSVFNHLVARARDTSGLYFTQLQTSSGVLHDEVTDDGSFTSQTQSAIALAYVRIAGILTTAANAAADAGADAAPSPSPQAKPYVNQTLAILTTLQTTPAFWDTEATHATLLACNTPVTPIEPCGSGYFDSLDPTKSTFDMNKSTAANARLFAALHRAGLLSVVAETNDAVPMFALFTANTGTQTSFVTVTPGQTAFVSEVTETFELTDLEDGGGLDGGPSAPLGLYYSANATTEAIEALNDQWLGLASAPAFFQ